MGNFSNVTDSDFDEKVLKSKTFVLVDFWAPWCGPCRMLSPILELIAKNYSDDQIQFFKMDTDQNVTPEDYNIQGIPTVKVFKDGKVVGEFVGARSADFVKNFLEKILTN